MKYDAAIIGAGPGGYECALKIARMGKKAILFEKDAAGGVCTNRGCIPTKSLAASADVSDIIRASSEFGIQSRHLGPDVKALYRRRDRIVATLRKGVERLLSDAGVKVVMQEAKIGSACQVLAGQKAYDAKNIIIATGSAPTGVGPLELDHDFVISGDDAATLDYLPKKVAVIGAGFIGCEYAAIYSSLGCEVALIEAQDRLLPGEDHDISALLERQLSRRLVIRKGARVESIDPKNHCVSTSDEAFDCDRVLLAVGRRPVYPPGMLDIGVDVEEGGIIVDSGMRTNIDNVYAIGDVTTNLKLAHAAYAAADVASKNAFGHDESVDYSAIPWCVFTQPEVGRMGITEALAPKGSLTGVANYLSNGKARCMGERYGFAKVILEKDSHKLIGAHIMGARASDLIGEAALALKNGLTAEEVSSTIHPHPTLCELIKSACEDAMA